VWGGDETDIPIELLILAAAGNDPLRAQELEEKLSPEWWFWWSVNQEAKAHGG
jgi:hypothetical protein